MCLRFVFLLITRTVTWLRLSRRQETWRIAEILILRHQLAVLQRRQPRRPKLNWADRALLAILLGAIPKARRQGLRLLVTPDTILRWHRDISARRGWRPSASRAPPLRRIRGAVTLCGLSRNGVTAEAGTALAPVGRCGGKPGPVAGEGASLGWERERGTAR